MRKRKTEKGQRRFERYSTTNSIIFHAELPTSNKDVCTRWHYFLIRLVRNIIYN